MLFHGCYRWKKKLNEVFIAQSFASLMNTPLLNRVTGRTNTHIESMATSPWQAYTRLRASLRLCSICIDPDYVWRKQKKKQNPHWLKYHHRHKHRASGRYATRVHGSWQSLLRSINISVLPNWGSHFTRWTAVDSMRCFVRNSSYSTADGYGGD